MDDIGAVALRFLILTASRTKPVRYAKWDEFDLDKSRWTVPSFNMKNDKEFRCSLSKQAVELIKGIEPLDDYVFTSGAMKRLGKPLSDGGISSVLRRMNHRHITVHGFRSTFRGYIGEETNLVTQVAEYALAHQVGTKSEQAYARKDMEKKRLDMMNVWGDYLTGQQTC